MLLIGSSYVSKTHYDILSVKEDASYDEIRAGYKAAILSSHPDKLQTMSEPLELHNQQQERFLNVQKAWEVLSDSLSRANYDKELRAARHELEVVDDEVSLEDMSVEAVDDQKELLYQCRCGDCYCVTAVELEEIGISLDENGRKGLKSVADVAAASIILPCGSCSLKIRLILDVNR